MSFFRIIFYDFSLTHNLVMLIRYLKYTKPRHTETVYAEWRITGFSISPTVSLQYTILQPSPTIHPKPVMLKRYTPNGGLPGSVSHRLSCHDVFFKQIFFIHSQHRLTLKKVLNMFNPSTMVGVNKNITYFY